MDRGGRKKAVKAWVILDKRNRPYFNSFSCTKSDCESFQKWYHVQWPGDRIARVQITETQKPRGKGK